MYSTRRSCSCSVALMSALSHFFIDIHRYASFMSRLEALHFLSHVLSLMGKCKLFTKIR